MNKKILRTLTALCAALMLTGGFSVTAFAQTPEMDPVHIFPINRDKENAVISRLFSMFSINLVQAKSSKNKGF